LYMCVQLCILRDGKKDFGESIVTGVLQE
jgi:hypothetical protein